MSSCKKCQEEKPSDEFYNKDRTCKECRKAMVRENRAKNIDYYREYNKNRYRNDPAVRERLDAYAKTDAGKMAAKRARSNYSNRYPMKRAAHIIVGNAVRDGRLIKSSVCETCGDEGSMDGHHDDYTKPFDVRWLCKKCHAQWHRDNKPIYGFDVDSLSNENQSNQD